MIVSLNWLKQFTNVKGSVDELATLIGSRLVEVEDIIDLSKKYANVTIADVKHVEKHPNADKLHVVHIDDGGVTKDIERLESGYVQIVCGAPNVREGIKVAWLPPGATVPNTYGKDAFILEARALRDVMSNGMLASAKELGIGEDHAGIVEIDKEVPAGTSFAEAYELNDFLLDIENKSLTHRPDCFGLIGFAREVAAIQGERFTTPEWLMATEPVLAPIDEKVSKTELSVKIENAAISTRYQLVALDSVDASKSSPFVIKTWLARVGIRPVSAVVDVTNYLMYLTGQPLHAFDLDKVLAVHPEHEAEIVVRESNVGEKLALLDGRTVTLAGDDIVICAGDTPIALAGAMGGASTEIDTNTKRVLLESATFDLYRLRNTQMRHGIFSEAVTRFTKGQNPTQTAPVLASAVRMLSDVAGARRTSAVVDEYALPAKPLRIELPLQRLNDTLGSNYSMKTATGVLTNVECDVDVGQSDTMLIRPPYWRNDLHIPEDIIEEVGRINGFDEIVSLLPQRPFKAIAPSAFDKTRHAIRETLVNGGANELLTYNFLSSQSMRRSDERVEDAFRLVNSLSPELEYYRMSLLPSLLAKVHSNHKLGYDSFALFELNKVHTKAAIDDDGLPIERDMLALVWSADDKKSQNYPGAAYYRAKKYVDFLAANLGFSPTYFPLSEGGITPWLMRHAAVFEPKRSAIIYIDKIAVGVVGEIKSAVAGNFKLPTLLAGFELDVRVLHESKRSGSTYEPLSRYPGTAKDICLRVERSVSVFDVKAVAYEAVSDSVLEATVTTADIYQNQKSDKKQITLTIHLTDPNKTITNEQANAVVADIAALAQKKVAAEIV